MANNDKTQYTLEDLKNAVKDLQYAEGDLGKVMGNVKTATDALRSHQVEADRLDQVVQQKKVALRNVINGLEKF